MLYILRCCFVTANWYNIQFQNTTNWQCFKPLLKIFVTDSVAEKFFRNGNRLPFFFNMTVNSFIGTKHVILAGYRLEPDLKKEINLYPLLHPNLTRTVYL